MSTFASINNGVAYADGNLLPASAINGMNGNALSSWMNGSFRSRRVTYTPATFPYFTSELNVDPSYSPLTGTVVIAKTDRIFVFTKYGDLINQSTDDLWGPPLYNYAGTYEPDLASVRVERWPAEAAGRNTMRYTTTSGGLGSTWGSATIPNFSAKGRPVWVGGASHVRIVPGTFSATATDTCLLVASGTATYVRHDLAFGTAPQRVAHDGLGRVVAASNQQIWYANAYGTNLASWANVAMPAGVHTSYSNRVGLDYDSRRSLFVMTAISSANPADVIFTTSPTGATWQPWKKLGSVANTGAYPDIACVNGAWIAQARSLEWPASNSSRVFVSLDGGATWSSIGNCYTEPDTTAGAATEQSMSLLSVGDRVVSCANFRDAEGIVLNIIGPIDSPATYASTVV